ncbi:hypothetical protein CcrColossus_gp166 [Caulobacter phage CcrColossus]|uniref:Uncharacterized protein n=1 Tax=Caulobacter phage CcrColossus TaxID=1211640 RepID=K4JSF0_9CAUD|nr:hypothetical protein CcrColossus_gp166 [Caulobacter phage CcrColossus]AFU88036.1 hypothetical protein CcrColossus_gp166 [Caulobacter phage CcrColossus]
MFDHASEIKVLLQTNLADWLERCLGKKTLNSRKDRAIRVLEEAIELAQAAGISREKALEQLNHTYGRPKGRPYQEIAGVLNAALLTAEAYGYDGLTLGVEEWRRVENKMDLIREKNRSKVQA